MRLPIHWYRKTGGTFRVREREVSVTFDSFRLGRTNRPLEVNLGASGVFQVGNCRRTSVLQRRVSNDAWCRRLHPRGDHLRRL